MFSLKDDEREIEIISENKRIDEIKILLNRVSMVLDGYCDQLKGLKFRMDRLKKEKEGSIYLVILVMLAEFAMIFLMVALPIFFIIGIPVTLAFYACFPFLLGSMIKRIFQYRVMTEEDKMINYIVRNKIITYKEEERFINRKIIEYEEILEKYKGFKEVSEEDIILLDKLTRPEQLYAEAVVKDFKMWPLWVGTLLWIVMAYFIISII